MHTDARWHAIHGPPFWRALAVLLTLSMCGEWHHLKNLQPHPQTPDPDDSKSSPSVRQTCTKLTASVPGLERKGGVLFTDHETRPSCPPRPGLEGDNNEGTRVSPPGMALASQVRMHPTPHSPPCAVDPRRPEIPAAARRPLTLTAARCNGARAVGRASICSRAWCVVMAAVSNLNLTACVFSLRVHPSLNGHFKPSSTPPVSRQLISDLGNCQSAPARPQGTPPPPTRSSKAPLLVANRQPCCKENEDGTAENGSSPGSGFRHGRRGQC